MADPDRYSILWLQCQYERPRVAQCRPSLSVTSLPYPPEALWVICHTDCYANISIRNTMLWVFCIDWCCTVVLISWWCVVYLSRSGRSVSQWRWRPAVERLWVRLQRCWFAAECSKQGLNLDVLYLSFSLTFDVSDSIICIVADPYCEHEVSVVGWSHNAVTRQKYLLSQTREMCNSCSSSVNDRYDKQMIGENSL